MNAPTRQPKIDRGCEEHDPRLYTVRSEARSGPDGLDNLSPADIKRYDEEGFLVVRNAFNAQTVKACLDALMDLIEGKNPAFDGVHLEASAARQAAGGAPVSRLELIRKLAHYVEFDDRFRLMAEDPALLRVVRMLCGGEPHLFQDMALLKPPGGREKPWHQDHAYFNLPLDARVVGVWIALDPATVHNGCMHVIPGGHAEGPQIHFKRRDWQICDMQMMGRPCVAVPLDPGSLLLFDGKLPHGTPTNHSKVNRRALQLHYHAKGLPQIPMEDRLAVFGSEGKDVEC